MTTHKLLEVPEKEWKGRKHSDRTALAGCSQAFCLFGNGGHFRHHTGRADVHRKNLREHKTELETTLARDDFGPAKDKKVQKSLDHEVKWAKKRLDQFPRQEQHRNAVIKDHLKQERINRGAHPQSHYDYDSDDVLFGR
ncbi:uncharacterized protein FA14DRAFT_161244 [Meira miltonrushii]|uniref:Uncharacterized protein n=1 Tax=Meira miltonrushii TaxID=1280837 RepID=A0A316VCR5_9BASI|nr:uncharacterized protein FA14DRAFT_161244 [Meira miltonrushii]PWN33345.1 hypothetical protein FA14DRAFT_161244 [Meira miltonrushii]